MSAREQQLRRLCSGETLQRARNLLKQVDILCSPGSGFAVSAEGRAGVPAMCALISSEELNNTDVKERDARANACLKPKIFNETLELIRRALEFHYKKQRAEERGLFYEKIIRSFKLPHVAFLRGQMEKVELQLVHSGQLKAKHRGKFDEEDDVVGVAVFYWTCGKCRVLGKRGISPATLSHHYDVEARDINEITKIIEAACPELGAEIWETVKRMKAAKSMTAGNPTTPVSSPTKPGLASQTPSPTKVTSPSKSALRANLYGTTPTTLTTPTHKRTVAFVDFDAATEETPTKPWKRRRLAADTQGDDLKAYTAFHSAVVTPRAGSMQGSASSLKVMLHREQTEEEEGADTDADGEAGDEFEPSEGEGLQSDHMASEMEVEGYIDTTVPLNDTSDDEAVPESSPIATEADGEGSTNSTPRRSQRLSHLPITPPRRSLVPPTRTSARTPTRNESKETASKRVVTPKHRKAQLQSSEDEVEEPAPRRRHRPVLLGHRQWAARDPELETQIRLAHKWKEVILKRYGYPAKLTKFKSEHLSK